MATAHRTAMWPEAGPGQKLQLELRPSTRGTPCHHVGLPGQGHEAELVKDNSPAPKFVRESEVIFHQGVWGVLQEGGPEEQASAEAYAGQRGRFGVAAAVEDHNAHVSLRVKHSQEPTTTTLPGATSLVKSPLCPDSPLGKWNWQTLQHVLQDDHRLWQRRGLCPQEAGAHGWH